MEPAKRSHHPLALLLVVVVIMVGALSGPSMADQVLHAGQSLTAGLSMREGNYALIMQADCNLILYDGGRAIWSTGTYGRGANCIVSMQTDGNLVVYNGGRRAVWASNTYGATGNYKLVLQSDHNLVIYLNGGAIWATGTNVRGSKAASILPSHAAGGGRNATAGPVAGGKGAQQQELN